MKTLYAIIWFALLQLLGACDDEQQQLFSGATSLHFALSDSELDSISQSFLNTTENQIVVKLPVELNGYAKQDYRFRLTVNPEGTTAEAGRHYEALEESYTIPKDEYQLEVPVILNYSGELDSLSVKLVVDLEPLDDLIEGIPYRQQATIISSNLLPPISNWSSRYLRYLGEYSRVKHRYVRSELKLDNFETGWASLPSNRKTAYGMQMNNFFAENEIYDENGKLIEPWM